MDTVWGLLRRRPGISTRIPLEWLGSSDFEWTDSVAEAELVAVAHNGRVLVHAERRNGVWRRLPFGIEFRDVPGEPRMNPSAAGLVAWAIGRIREPAVLPVDHVTSLVTPTVLGNSAA
ncbi:MAG: hypothetical protein IMX00_04395 [Limnochordales bacterium]|nr:hypothetical protein [Limnochordales bacterium]